MRFHAGGFLLALTASALALTADAPRAHAQAARGSEAAPGPRSGATRVPIATLRAQLASGDAATVSAALAALGRRSERAAVDALAAFLVVGQDDAWADRGIEALGNTRSADARPLLAELAHHRRAHARVLAYQGLAHIAGEQSDKLLADGLRDSDADVRGTCATQLGERGARAQLELLLRALERGVPEAAPAIGKLGDAETVTRYGAFLQRLPIQVMLSGYGEFLVRPDLPEAVKLEIVARLGEVAGVTVKRFLEQLVAKNIAKGLPSFQHALRETAKRIDDGSKPVAKPKP